MICTCGQQLKGSRGGFALHLRSVFHQQGERIRALLGTPCITYQEIGNRLGVTRERIRQIHESILDGDGRTRQHVCTLSKPKRMPSANSLVMKFREVCLKKGIPFSFSPMGVRSFHSYRAIVNGQTVTFLKATVNNGTYTTIRRSSFSAQITVYLLPGGNWMMVPFDKLPKFSTTFQEMPNRDGVGFGKYTRHDWPDYIENWRVFK